MSEPDLEIGAGSMVLYVYENADGVRSLTGGGIMADGCCVDISGTVSPHGVWNGMHYEDLAPGRYKIVGSGLVRQNDELHEL